MFTQPDETDKPEKVKFHISRRNFIQYSAAFAGGSFLLPLSNHQSFTKQIIAENPSVIDHQ